MTTTTVVRYVVKPERAEENADLVRAVYAELAELQPAGFTYRTFQLEDGVTFVHVAATEDGPPPLPQLDSFLRFQEGIGDRCVEQPVVGPSKVIGSYG